MHYGHYAAHTSSNLISSVKCDLVNLAVKDGSPLGRCERSTLVMLEKAPGNYKVKIKSIIIIRGILQYSAQD